MQSFAISPAKANHLYWLGRYAERVYQELHLLPRYSDSMIDGAPGTLRDYVRCLRLDAPGDQAESTLLYVLYAPENPASIQCAVEAAFDNGLLLREEIQSETLAYILMARSTLAQASKQQDLNLAHLQPVVDDILAFFGSVGERVFDERIRTLLKIGRLVENIDVHVRFHYPFHRVREVYDALQFRCQRCEGLYNKELAGRLDALLTQDRYNQSNLEYEDSLLYCVNHLVKL